MKHLLIITLSLISLTACKKDPTNKAFLYGRLLNECNGNAVANEKISFYQNFTASTGIFSSDILAKTLEETTTDENGYFYFYGDEYVNQSTSSIYNSSLILENGTHLALGILGEGTGKNVGENDPKIKNIGDLYKNGMSLDINLKISNLNNGVSYDSVLVYGFGLDTTELYLENPVQNYFTITKSNTLQKIEYWLNSDVNYGKYSLNLSFYFYKNGTIDNTQGKTYYFSPCQNNTSIVFDF